MDKLLQMVFSLISLILIYGIKKMISQALVFRNPQDYRWPIPESEQDINPNLRN